MTLSETSPLPIPAASAAPAADPFLALLTDCESADASIFSSVPILASLTANLVARNNEWVQQALAQVASFRSALLARKTRLLGSNKWRARKQCKEIVADFEAVDVSTEQLRVWAAVAGAETVCPDLDCAFAASPLLALPRLVFFPIIGVSFSIVQSVDRELGSVATGDGLRMVSAAGPGLKWFEPHSRNEFSVVLVQADGSVPVWLTTGDVVVEVLSAVGSPSAAGMQLSAAAVARTEWVRQGIVSVVYGGVSEDAPEALLQLSVCGAHVADATGDCGWCVRVPRKPLAVHECAAVGTHVRTLSVVAGTKCGMAVSADEKWLVVGLEVECTLSVYSLPGGELVRTFGADGDGPLQFDGLRRLCFTPHDTLIVVEQHNKRLQEVVLAGVFGRFIDVGVLGDGSPNSYCVAVHDDVIAVGCGGGTGPRVALFDLGSGLMTSQFGWEGIVPGQLSRYCTGVRFTPDGSCIIVAEWQAKRLSVFTTAGVFVRCVGVGVLGGGHSDVMQSVSGEYVVADYSKHRVCVFSPDGSELVRSWGLKGTGDGQFDYPIALAAAGRNLYVMDKLSGRVQVFD